jgi:hypothetical protein
MIANHLIAFGLRPMWRVIGKVIPESCVHVLSHQCPSVPCTYEQGSRVML